MTDAVVIGAGPNGLVAANHLVDAGWSVLVLEAQPDLGGAVRSAQDVHPRFVHDTFSAFYPLAAASATIRSFHLEDHGLEWTHAPAVLGHPFPDGSWGLLHRDREITARLMEEKQRHCCIKRSRVVVTARSSVTETGGVSCRYPGAYGRRATAGER